MPARPFDSSTLRPVELSSEYPFFAAPKPRVIGHRGAAGLVPENTLPSFQRAFADGAALVELDVRQSSDEEIVIIHDATLDRTTDGSGPVSERPLRELKRLDAGFFFTTDGGATFPFRGQGFEIPTLEEFLEGLPGARAIVEIKQLTPSVVAKTVDTIAKFAADDRVLLATEDDAVMAAIRAELKRRGRKIATGFCYSEVAAFIGWVAGGLAGSYRPPGQAFQLPPAFNDVTLVSAATIAAAHRLGLEIFVWTINDPDEMNAFLELGVDGIITDYPARLFALVRQRR
ncbi:MAG TPA: glycerophosphodiester phosphodiesterase [Candidatus Acidoferrales bacterium]|nr:glycerophosphodiester phosphodiesterase [Candidatus Acidoferrales bacterium]